MSSLASSFHMLTSSILFLGTDLDIVKIHTGEVVDLFEVTGGDPGRCFIVSTTTTTRRTMA